MLDYEVWTKKDPNDKVTYIRVSLSKSLNFYYALRRYHFSMGNFNNFFYKSNYG